MLPAARPRVSLNLPNFPEQGGCAAQAALCSGAVEVLPSLTVRRGMVACCSG